MMRPNSRKYKGYVYNVVYNRSGFVNPPPRWVNGLVATNRVRPLMVSYD